MTKQQQIDTLQKQLDAANEQIANIDNALKEQREENKNESE